ncbi:zinc-binding dehydrogenase [Parafilimonas sp.]|uniref:zinc-binding dehydrogenase n=1 Tax=Parafilimonas sp. TaxID=1969739 RepID=UPI0039E66FDD
MKAAVINGFGEIPQYADFPDPVTGGNEKLVQVNAAVLENFDKGTSADTHYSSKTLFPKFPAIVGNDGVGITENGDMVAFGAVKPPYGAFAEKAAAGYAFLIPEGIDAADAAAILPSALTSLLPLKYAARLQPGETVFVNGATGVSGRIAVQIAKILGAGKIVVSGRNQASLTLLKTLGADETISLMQDDEKLSENITAAGGDNGYDVVIDFLWGHPAEMLINTFIPKEAGFAKRRIRYIQTGEKAGPHISIPGSAFRTSGLEMMGVGKISNEALMEEINVIWQLIKEKKLYMDIEKVALKNISEAWQRTELAGKRLVIVP